MRDTREIQGRSSRLGLVQKTSHTMEEYYQKYVLLYHIPISGIGRGRRRENRGGPTKRMCWWCISWRCIIVIIATLAGSRTTRVDLQGYGSTSCVEPCEFSVRALYVVEWVVVQGGGSRRACIVLGGKYRCVGWVGWVGEGN